RRRPAPPPCRPTGCLGRGTAGRGSWAGSGVVNQAGSDKPGSVVEQARAHLPLWVTRTEGHATDARPETPASSWTGLGPGFRRDERIFVITLRTARRGS